MKKATCHVVAASGPHESEFPDGTRVLVVDDSMVCLRVISALLRKCRYQVTPTQSSAQALKLLRENVDNFDLVLTNVHMHEIDGFKMLEVGLELDLPVIMMSASDEKQTIMKGIRHGARDFLLKPLRKEEIKNLWQHVYRKTLLSMPFPVKGCQREEHDPTNKASRVAERKGTEGFDEENVQGKIRLERVRWTQPLHDLFVRAVEKHGGIDRAVPKKILEEMGCPNITREKVASHLQKYRKALKKQDELVLQGQGMQDGRTNRKMLHHLLNSKQYNIPSSLMAAPPPPPPCPSVAFGGSASLVGPRMGSGSTYHGQSSALVIGDGYNSCPLETVPPNSTMQQFVYDGNTYNLHDHSTTNFFFDGTCQSLLDSHF